MPQTKTPYIVGAWKNGEHEIRLRQTGEVIGHIHAYFQRAYAARSTNGTKKDKFPTRDAACRWLLRTTPHN